VVIFAPGNDTSVFSIDYQSLLEAYLSRGISVMAFDYSEVGLSEGVFSTTESYTDIEAVYQELKRRGFEDARIMVEGYSYGSCPALSLGARHPDLYVLLRCPMGSPEDAVEGWLLFDDRHTSRLKIGIGRLITGFAMPSKNELWAQAIPEGHLHIIYANDPLERDMHPHQKLLKAHLGHEPTEEELALHTKWTGREGYDSHFDVYHSSPTPGHQLTEAFDAFLGRIGFTAIPPH
jgi:pimeloyl-ACP methyl ester carboxylesterase